MKNRFFILLIFLLSYAADGLSQSDNSSKVAIYVDVSNTTINSSFSMDIRSYFHNIMRNNGFEVAPDSTASRMAQEYRRSNATRTGDIQNKQKKTEYLYILTPVKNNGNVELFVSVIDVENRLEVKNKQSVVSNDLISKHPLEATKLLAYELGAALNLVSISPLKEELDSLRKWKKETLKREQSVIISNNNKYTVLSFLTPVNQLRSHTSKGTINGVAILTGYGISISSFIISTNSYNANKRKFDNISVDLTESNKAREHYKGQMDICRGGQIASGILFVGTYIYGVANALANRNTYKKNSNVSFVPVTYDNGAGVALVYNF